VDKESIDSFSSMMRSKGGSMENFTITGRDSINRVIPIDRQYDHLVILWTVPVATDRIVRGYAITTEYGKNITAIKAKETKKPAVSPVTTLGNRVDFAIAIVVSTPIFNASTNEVVGSLNGAIVVGGLISSALNGVIEDVNVILRDDTPDAPDDGFVYSTETYANGKNLNKEDAMRSVSASVFSVPTSMIFTDRKYTLLFTPTSRYLSRYERLDKWIALILPLIIMFILLGICVIVFFLMRLLQARKDIIRKKQMYRDLNEKQKSLQGMRDNTAREMKKFRTIYNNIPGYILVIDSQGFVSDMNVALEKDTGYTSKHIEQGLTISSMIPAITPENLTSIIDTKIDTTIKTTLADNIKVFVQIFTLMTMENTSISISEPVGDAYLVFAERV